MLHPQPMQQCDQATPALVGDAAFALDPGADLTRRPRQSLGDPTLQLVLLRIAQATRAAAETKARQALDAFVLVQAIPRADGVIVADHAGTRVGAELIRKRLLRVPTESGYTTS